MEQAIEKDKLQEYIKENDFYTLLSDLTNNWNIATLHEIDYKKKLSVVRSLVRKILILLGKEELVQECKIDTEDINTVKQTSSKLINLIDAVEDEDKLNTLIDLMEKFIKASKELFEDEIDSHYKLYKQVALDKAQDDFDLYALFRQLIDREEKEIFTRLTKELTLSKELTNKLNSLKIKWC